MKERAMRLNPADRRVFYLMVALLVTAVVALSLINIFLLPDNLYSAGAGVLSEIEMRLVGEGTQAVEASNTAGTTMRLVDLLAK
jgi:hypothetical protein